MPGHQRLRDLRAHPRGARPVAARHHAHRLRRSRRRVRKGYDAGADDFLQKPVDTPQLVLKVRAFLRLKSLHDESDRSRREAQERARSLALLHEIGRDWSLIAEPEEFHRMVTERLAGLIGAPICLHRALRAGHPHHGRRPARPRPGRRGGAADPLRRPARVPQPLGLPLRAALPEQPRAAGPAPRAGGRAGGGRGVDGARAHDLGERGARPHRGRQQAGRLHGVATSQLLSIFAGPGRLLPAQPPHLRRASGATPRASSAWPRWWGTWRRWAGRAELIVLAVNRTRTDLGYDRVAFHAADGDGERLRLEARGRRAAGRTCPWTRPGCGWALRGPRPCRARTAKASASWPCPCARAGRSWACSRWCASPPRPSPRRS